jgi:hypothetical protein
MEGMEGRGEGIWSVYGGVEGGLAVVGGGWEECGCIGCVKRMLKRMLVS